MTIKQLLVCGIFVGISAVSANADVVTLPSGSSLSATVIRGVSFSKSESNITANDPTPILLTVTEGNLKNCLIMVDTIPNWSANRVSTRINKFICNNKTSYAEGWIVDTDNKADIRNSANTTELLNVNAGTNVKVVIYKRSAITDGN